MSPVDNNYCVVFVLSAFPVSMYTFDLQFLSLQSYPNYCKYDLLPVPYMLCLLFICKGDFPDSNLTDTFSVNSSQSKKIINDATMFKPAKKKK